MTQFNSYFSMVFVTMAAIVCQTSQVEATGLCAGSTYNPLCKSVVKSGMTDATAATAAMIRNVIEQTKKVREESTKLSTNDQTIQICLQSYDDAVDNLNQALELLKTGDKGSTNSRISAAIASYNSCDDSYAEEDAVSPLIDSNTLLQHKLDNCLSVYRKAP